MCFLRVHHDRGPKQYYEPVDWEVNLHICESTAYNRLQEHGLCECGIIPKFYGTIEDLDPKLHQPYLNLFLEDEYFPKVIVLEYIPGAQELNWSNYTKKIGQLL
ncbi:hypothetical protein BDW59DRAFT_156536 [Aspergillus cavernicola]|uniref:Aminoglycoside phosphotransferase domain-containing protein n=1 Tax=Aspergillus cavernicola TaxID=176166 RepID=A0ABR4J163_9EURO